MTVNNKESVTRDRAKPFSAFDSNVYYGSDRLSLRVGASFFLLFRRLCLDWSERRWMGRNGVRICFGGGVQMEKTGKRRGIFLTVTEA